MSSTLGGKDLLARGAIESVWSVLNTELASAFCSQYTLMTERYLLHLCILYPCDLLNIIHYRMRQSPGTEIPKNLDRQQLRWCLLDLEVTGPTCKNHTCI